MERLVAVGVGWGGVGAGDWGTQNLSAGGHRGKTDTSRGRKGAARAVGWRQGRGGVGE